MPLKLNSSGGGSVTVQEPSTASNLTFTLPSATSKAAYADSSDNLQVNSGYGSYATGYVARAWVNFNGTGTVAIRASGNVTSITDNGVGNYTVNFTNAMPDVNYCVTGISDVQLNVDNNPRTIQFISFSTSSLQISTNDNTGVKEDSAYVNVAIFR